MAIFIKKDDQSFPTLEINPEEIDKYLQKLKISMNLTNIQ